jgi:hypothetical protein
MKKTGKKFLSSFLLAIALPVVLISNLQSRAYAKISGKHILFGADGSQNCHDTKVVRK